MDIHNYETDDKAKITWDYQEFIKPINNKK